MARFEVTFVEYHKYEVCAEDPDEAVDMAIKEYRGRYHVDDILVEEVEE